MGFVSLNVIRLPVLSQQAKDSSRYLPQPGPEVSLEPHSEARVWQGPRCSATAPITAGHFWLRIEFMTKSESKPALLSGLIFLLS